MWGRASGAAAAGLSVLILAWAIIAIHTPSPPRKFFAYDFQDIPPDFALAQTDRSHCRWSAYNSELILYNSLLKHPARTLDKRSADFFIAPFFGACYLFNCWTKNHWNQSQRCHVDQYALPLLEWVLDHSGQDDPSSILFFNPMDHVDQYYNASSLALMRKTTYLVTNADTVHKSAWRPSRDIVIPSATHLLNSYHVHPRDYIDAFGQPYVDILKDTVEVDYLDLGRPSLASRGSHGHPSSFMERLIDRLRSSFIPKKNRELLAVFRGSLKGGHNYAFNIRPQLQAFADHPSFDIKESSSNHEYATALAHAKFGLAPPGYTLDTTRIWEYLAFGVVPVFLGTGPLAGQVMPFASIADWVSCSLFVPVDAIHQLSYILGNVSRLDYQRLFQCILELRSMVLEDIDGTTWDWISRDLSHRTL